MVHLSKNLPVHLSVTLALYMNSQHLHLFGCGGGLKELSAAWRFEVRQRDTAQYLMTHYSYTYSLLLAAL